MILSDSSIRELIKKGELIIEPFEEANIQASSIDLRLGDEVIIYEDDFIDIKQEDIKVKKIKFDNSFIIEPKAFVLATTIEYIKLPNYITAFVEGRSSLGRLGLFIENAGWVDAGFEGQITLELYNSNKSPIKLYSNMKICQIVLAKLDRPAQKPYRGKYQGQRGVVASRIYKDFQK